MAARWLTCLMLAASLAFAAPWRVVCAPGCWQACEAAGAGCTNCGPGPSCCGSAAEPTGALAATLPSGADADACCGEDSSAAASCCEVEEAVGTCECGESSEGEDGGACASCCCGFVPLAPCRGCDFSRLTLWVPSKDQREAGGVDGVEAGYAVATIALPRAVPKVRCVAPARPPWRPSGTGLLSRICLLTI